MSVNCVAISQIIIWTKQEDAYIVTGSQTILSETKTVCTVIKVNSSILLMNNVFIVGFRAVLIV